MWVRDTYRIPLYESSSLYLGDSVLLAREKQILTNVKKSKKDQRNSATASVIRVVHDDWEIGKLENMYAVMLGCLLDKNYVFIEAEVLSPPSDWNYFSPFTLKAKVKTQLILEILMS